MKKTLKLVEQPGELDNETRLFELQLKKHRAKIATHQRLMEEHQALVKHHQAQLEELQPTPKPAVNFLGIPLELLRRWTLETAKKKPTINWSKYPHRPKPPISEAVGDFFDMIAQTKLK